MVDYSSRITRDPKISGGEAVIRGTRIPLRTVLASLADGDTPEQIITAFPVLAADNIRAVIANAAISASEDLPFLGAPAA